MIKLEINNKIYETDVPAGERLLDTLRERLNLTGTKCGCRQGECGACAIILDGKVINSCLLLTHQAQGKKITTIEGLHHEPLFQTIKKSFLTEGAVQCGFCTPGIVISTFSLLKKNLNPQEAEIKTALSGHLCRCTGYQKIILAIKNTPHYLGAKK